MSIYKELKPYFDNIADSFRKIDKRFEQIDKRFDKVDQRFEITDQNFQKVDKRFEVVNKRFDHVEKKVDHLTVEVAVRFKEMDEKIDTVVEMLEFSHNTLRSDISRLESRDELKMASLAS